MLGREMTAVHIVLGVAVVAANLAAGLYGAVAWWRWFHPPGLLAAAAHRRRRSSSSRPWSVSYSCSWARTSRACTSSTV